MPTSAPGSTDESFQTHPTRKPHSSAPHSLSGAFRTPHTSQHSLFHLPPAQPSPTALPGCSRSHGCVSKLHLPENKPEVCSADNNARPCRSQACAGARAGRGAGHSLPIPSGKQHLGAALSAGILRAPAARQCPHRGNPSSHPTYSHGSHRYKKEIPSLPAALREGFRSWVGQQHLQVLWHEKVVSQSCSAPAGCTELPQGSSCFGVCIVFNSSIWG